MHRSGLVAVALVSSLAGAAAPSAAVLDFGVVGGDARLGGVYAERFATRLDQRGVKVITQQAVSSMLSLERQKQILGCADAESTNCMAELAGALGTTHLVAGQVAKVGEAWQINVRTVVTKTTATFTSFSKTVGTDEAVLEAIVDAAENFVFALDPTLATPRIAPWVLVGAGLGAAAVGAVLLARVVEANAKLRGPIDETFTPGDAAALAEARGIEQTIGVGLPSAVGWR